MTHGRKPPPTSGRLPEPREQSPMANNTLYDTLEVIPTASPQTIQAAYRSLISRYHPDKVVGLGPELQAIADARTKAINNAYHILGHASRRARYDEELREAESDDEELREAESYDDELPEPESYDEELPAAGYDEELPEVESRSLHRQDLAVPPRAPAVTPDRRQPRGRRPLATLVAALSGIVALLTLTLATNLLFGVADFFLTGHARYFQGFVNSIDISASYSGASYLLVLWSFLFVGYMFGLISYRLGVGVGRRIASGFGEPVAGANDRLLLFLALVGAIATGELLSPVHTMPNIFADMFALGGAYLAERGMT